MGAEIFYPPISSPPNCALPASELEAGFQSRTLLSLSARIVNSTLRWESAGNAAPAYFLTGLSIFIYTDTDTMFDGAADRRGPSIIGDNAPVHRNLLVVRRR